MTAVGTIDRALNALYRPSSIAVVGASSHPAKWGSVILRNIVDRGFGGPVYPVNPKGGQLLGNPVYPSLRELPDVPDMVFVTVAAAHVPAVVEEAGGLGVPVAVVATSGFAESGPAGRQAQEALVATATGLGIRLVGPNCMGVYSAHGTVYASMALEPSEPGGTAVLSQSGNIGVALFRQGRHVDVRFHSFVSVGNQADLTFADYLDYLADDPTCTSACLYLEGVHDGRSLFNSMLAFSARKPLVVLKGGRREAGRQAAASHTGSLATDDRVFSGFCDAAGAVLVDSYEQAAAATAAFQASVNAPIDSVGVLTDGGGFGVLASDALSRYGLTMKPTSTLTQRQLHGFLPAYCAVSNPVDIGGDSDSDPRVFASAAAALLDAPEIDALLITGGLGLYSSAYDQALAGHEIAAAVQLAELATSAHKPLLIQSLAARDTNAVIEAFHEAEVPVFESVELAAFAMAALDRHGRFRAGTGAAEPSARRQDLLAAPDHPGDEPALYELLERSGVPVPRFSVVTTEHDAARAADLLGYPVVAKAVIDAAHKSDLGGVELDLLRADDVQAAFGRLVKLSDRVLLAEQIPAGIELIASVSADPSWGPFLLCGLGGTSVEAFDGTLVMPIPFSDHDLRCALARIPVVGHALTGRGRYIYDVDQLIGVLRSLGDVIEANPTLVQLELNPIVVRPDGIQAVDAKATWVTAKPETEGSPTNAHCPSQTR